MFFMWQPILGSLAKLSTSKHMSEPGQRESRGCHAMSAICNKPIALSEPVGHCSETSGLPLRVGHVLFEEPPTPLKDAIRCLKQVLLFILGNVL